MPKPYSQDLRDRVIDAALIVSPSFAVATDVRAILLARDEGLLDRKSVV